MRTLRDVKCGSYARVVKIHGEGPVKRHIMDMGITKNCVVSVYRKAPLGDPLVIRVRGYELTLRKEDAENIEVEG